MGLAGNDKRAVFLPPSLRDYITCPKASVIEITIGLRDVMQAVDEAVATEPLQGRIPHRRPMCRSGSPKTEPLLPMLRFLPTGSPNLAIGLV